MRTTTYTHSEEAVIEVRDLRKSYGHAEAVRGVSFEVSRGEVFCLLGPNGAGKTTTVEILEGYRTQHVIVLAGNRPQSNLSRRRDREHGGVQGLSAPRLLIGHPRCCLDRRRGRAYVLLALCRRAR
jgi:ABC-type glutathione transport system ATPase component